VAEDKTFTKDELDAAVEKAVEAIDVDGLKGKIEELIGDKKKLQAEARKAKDVDPAEVERLHSEVEDLTTKLTAATKIAKDAEGARDKAVKALETEQGFTQRLLIQDGLKTALIANGVKDEDFIDSLAAKFAAGAKVVTEGEERKAVYGDKPLGDFIKEWAGTDVGKKFVSAPANSGGGANGGAKTGEGGKRLPQSEVDAMRPKDKAQFFADGGQYAEAVT